jgi:hypothetical protein
MKQDTYWNTVSTLYDPLTLYQLIERTVLAHTEDQYLFATVYDQELTFYSFKQKSLSNPNLHERFNTKVDVGEAIGVTRQHKVLLEYVAQELHTQDFADLGDVEHHVVRDDTKERYVSYNLLQQSGTQNGNLKVNLQNDFTTRYNCYPKNCQHTLHLLDKYSKTVVDPATQSEGNSFAQRSGREVDSGKISDYSTYNKKYWKNKECYKCHKRGHTATHFPTKSNKSDKYECYRSLASTASSVDKLKRDLKSTKKAFTTVNTQRALLKEANSDISKYEGDDEASHFQVDAAIQLVQVDKEFEPRIAKPLKQTHGSTIKPHLQEVILLDSQSTMDLFCNTTLVGKTIK